MELECSRVEQMNHSTTINHPSLGTFHTLARYNNSVPVTMGAHVIVSKLVLVQTNVSKRATHEC